MPALEREIEIRLTLLPSETYHVDLRDIDPASNAVDDTFSGPAAFNFDELRRLAAAGDQQVYGRTLSQMLFAAPDVKARFEKAYSDTIAAFRGALHLRLFIDASAKNLNAIRWELLRHPDPKLDLPLTSSENVLFSRFVTTASWNSVKRRPSSKFRALIAISNPRRLTDFGFADLAPEKFVPSAKTALARFDPQVLGDAASGFLTRSALMKGLQEDGSGYDILYLICHGTLDDGVPKLIFQNSAGEREDLPGDDFVADLAGLKNPPRLIVLASCESGASDAGFAEQALAPRLAVQAGIPAIVAMQAKVSADTVNLIMPVFFTALAEDGQTDRAMALARAAAVRANAADAWVPALYSRLKDGRLWYKPGFGDDQNEAALPWSSICLAVQKQEIVPVLGPDMAEYILGSSADIARALGEKNGIPLPADTIPDLPRIAQTIEKKESRPTLEAHCDAIATERLRTLAAGLPAPPGVPNASAPERIAFAHAADPDDPFRILADLDLKVYVSCAMDSLLKQFLKFSPKRKFPIELFTAWRDESQSLRPRLLTAAADLRDRIAAAPSVPPLQTVAAWRDGLLRPEDEGSLPDELAAAADTVVERLRFFSTADPAAQVAQWYDLLEHPPFELRSKPWNPATPIVYYAFGRYTYKKTWVLTQDDFFSYLIQHSRFALVPPMVSAKLASGSLLFLGFSLDDWTFRILLRLIRSQQGAHQLKGRRHIGVQIDPENHSRAEAAKVKSILSRYLVDDAFTIDVYWGTGADFLRDLRDRLKEPRYQLAQVATHTEAGDSN